MWVWANQDAALVRRTLKGETEAFGVLVERYLAAVRAQAYVRVRTRVDAEDVAQEAFLRAYEKLDTLREPHKFAPWLLGIARHCAGRVREQRLRAATYAEQSAPQDAEVFEPERRELLSLLERELEQLDDVSREMVLLYYFARRSTRHIAAAMDTTPAAVRKRLQRARNVLAERLLHDAARAEAKNADPKRVMGLIAALPNTWKSTIATAGATAADVLSGGTIMKIAMVVVCAGVAVVGLFVRGETSVETSPVAAAPEADLASVVGSEPAPQQRVEDTAAGQGAPSPAKPTEISSVWERPVRGLVIDLAERPVEGASVRLTVFEEPFFRRPARPATVITDVWGTTDAKGEFLLTVPVETGAHHGAQFAVRKGDHYKVEITFVSGNYRDERYTLKLHETGTLTGRVSDPQGNPVADAVIRPTSFESSTPGIGWPGVGEYGSILSDSDGRFAFNRLYLGAWRFAATAPGFARTDAGPFQTGSQDLESTVFVASMS